MNAKTEKKFWAAVSKEPGQGPKGDCWQRGAAKSYGRFYCGLKRPVKAHRVAYELAFGAFPPEMLVCHTCDNPPCCNPAHLFLGTSSDNMKDAFRKGRLNLPKGGVWRSGPGRRPPNIRLNESLVRSLRERYGKGEGFIGLAREIGVHQNTVYRMLIGDTWKHVI